MILFLNIYYRIWLKYKFNIQVKFKLNFREILNLPLKLLFWDFLCKKTWVFVLNFEIEKFRNTHEIIVPSKNILK